MEAAGTFVQTHALRANGTIFRLAPSFSVFAHLLLPVVKIMDLIAALNYQLNPVAVPSVCILQAVVMQFFEVRFVDNRLSQNRSGLAPPTIYLALAILGGILGLHRTHVG